MRPTSRTWRGLAAFLAALLGFLLPGRPIRTVVRNGGAPCWCWATRMSIARSRRATDFTRDFQDLITRFAWDAVWTRPGSITARRRLLVLAITASMGRWEEFRLHLGAGIADDLEWPDVEEVLLQTAVYAGVPAANTGFNIAAEQRRM